MDSENNDSVEEVEVEEANQAAPSPDRAVAVAAYVAKALADEPDEVNVTASAADGVTRIDVQVAPGDVGRIIGKRGKVANSVRSIVRAAAHLDGAKVDVEFD